MSVQLDFGSICRGRSVAVADLLMCDVEEVERVGRNRLYAVIVHRDRGRELVVLSEQFSAVYSVE